MTWATRGRLFVGIVLVLALCATLTLVLNRRASQATSVQATIVAQEVRVGVDYAGTVIASHVEAGDTVAAGDPVFTLRSLLLSHDLSIGIVSPEAAGYEITGEGEMVVTAPVDGVVAEMIPGAGGFVSAGDVVATLYQEGSAVVDARMLLDPADFARVQDGAEARITLPDRTDVTGHVESIAVRSTQNQAEATVVVASPVLARRAGEGLVLPGTPVEVSVELYDEGPLADADLAFRQFLRKIGL